jgi:hypothetical protein
MLQISESTRVYDSPSAMNLVIKNHKEEPGYSWIISFFSHTLLVIFKHVTVVGCLSRLNDREKETALFWVIIQ